MCPDVEASVPSVFSTLSLRGYVPPGFEAKRVEDRDPYNSDRSHRLASILTVRYSIKKCNIPLRQVGRRANVKYNEKTFSETFQTASMMKTS